jgi:hypothetical protein
MRPGICPWFDRPRSLREEGPRIGEDAVTPSRTIRVQSQNIFSAIRNQSETTTKPATTQLPHAFKRIRLEIARSKEFPSGSSRHGYEFVAPLDGNGHIDPSLWRQHRDNCRVRRFWGGEEEIGHLFWGVH